MIKQIIIILSCSLFIIFSALGSASNDKEIAEPKNDDSLYQVKYAQTAITVGAGQEHQRDVNLSVTYPSGNNKYPLIVFSHGHALDNLSYRNLTDYWVERGYVVVAPLHHDSGGDLKRVSEISKKYGNDWIAASRLLELTAVINQIDVITNTLSDFKGQVSVERVIAAGHSYGALSSQQLAGANLEQNNNSIYQIPNTLVDPRVVAVVAVSPPGLMKDHLTEKTWEGFKKPQLVVTGPNDYFPFIWPNYEDHFVSYLTAEPGHNYLLVLDEMDHYLGGLIGRLDRDTPRQVLAMENLREVSMKFIEHYLRSESYKDDKLIKPLRSHLKTSNKNGVLRFEHR